MNERTFEPAWEYFIRDLLSWFRINFLSMDALIQGSVILGLYISGKFLTRLLVRKIQHPEAENGSHWIPTILAQNFKETLFFSFFLIVLWGFSYGTQKMGYPHTLFEIFAKLTTAWVLIRVSSYFLENSAFTRFVAGLVWTVTALAIVDLLRPTIKFLKELLFKIGEIEFTAFAIVKGIFVFTFLFWTLRILFSFFEAKLKGAKTLTPSQQVLFVKLIKILLVTLAVFIGLNYTGIDLMAFAVFSGGIGLGVGFGLQKVFSNLISGIILLLDKSIKPGDVIAIGNSYGWVNNLDARYVSVLTRDGKEYLIPNENLITQNVENWSHSSNKVRLHISLGISYDSDLHKAMQLMIEAAAETPRVLQYPKPICNLISFDENSIHLELRVWIEDPVNGMANIKSAVQILIWAKFKEEGIHFPYPQRDIHIKSMPKETFSV